jgi:Zn-dependent M28 family amino/carboxypeptidase
MSCIFLALFDSVLAAPRATDDGMNVVALVEILDFLSKNHPLIILHGRHCSTSKTGKRDRL